MNGRSGIIETIQQKVERIVREKFYTGPLSGATERLTKALIEEFKLNDENMGNS